MPDSVSTITLDKTTLTAPLMNGEKLFSPAGLARAATNVPGHRGGAHLNGSTIFRYINRGNRTKNGELVRLEAVRVGSRWLTSLEAFARFSAKLTEDALQQGDPPAAPTPRQRNRAAESATATLDKIMN